MAAAALLRKDGPAHKRLMLLSLLAISDAGFARWLAPAIGQGVGGMGLGPLASDFLPEYVCSTVLILALGGYDLVTRGRLQTAYVVGAVVVIGAEVSISALHISPAFTPLALRLIGG